MLEHAFDSNSEATQTVVAQVIMLRKQSWWSLIWCSMSIVTTAAVVSDHIAYQKKNCTWSVSWDDKSCVYKIMVYDRSLSISPIIWMAWFDVSKHHLHLHESPSDQNASCCRSSLWMFLISPAMFVAWVVWPTLTFEWKKMLTFGLWVDPYRVRRYEGQEGFSARHWVGAQAAGDLLFLFVRVVSEHE